MDRESTINQFRMIYRYMAEHIHSILLDFTCEDMLYMGYFPQLKAIALDRMVEDGLITKEYLDEISDHASCPLCKYDTEQELQEKEKESQNCEYCPIRFKESDYGGCNTYIMTLSNLLVSALQHGVNGEAGKLYCKRLRDKLQEIAELPEW